MTETTLATPEVASSVMNAFINQTPTPPQIGDLVDGTVSAIGRARVYVDLHPFGAGLIFGREYMNARDILRKVRVGDAIAAKVIDVKLDRHSSGLTQKLQLRARTFFLLKLRRLTKADLSSSGRVSRDSFQLHSYQQNTIRVLLTETRKRSLQNSTTLLESTLT
jgi:ribosomal protein S1